MIEVCFESPGESDYFMFGVNYYRGADRNVH